MSEGIDSLLQEGEHTPPMAASPRGSQEWTYGYAYGEIENSTHRDGNSVVLEIEPRGAVEPVIITEDIVLSVRALRGRGYAVISNTGQQDNGVRMVPMDAASGPLALGLNDAYFYLNAGDEKLVLRDDATPAFQGHEETQLTARPMPEGTLDGRTISLPARFWQAFEFGRRVEDQSGHADSGFIREAELLVQDGHAAMDYRPVVVGAIRDEQGRVLLGQSAKHADEWGFIQGGIDEGEALRSALLRESFEEAGIPAGDLAIGALTEITDSDIPASRSDKRGFSRGKRYFVLQVRYSGTGSLTLDPSELSGAGFFEPDEAKRYILNKRSGKRELIDRALAL